MKTKLSILALAGILIAVTVFLRKQEQESDAIAIVDGTPVTEESFRYWWERNQPVEDTADTRREILDALLERTALANRAREAGLDRDPQIVEAIESLLIARLKETELQPKLAAAEISEEEARRYYDANLGRYATEPQLRVAVLWFNTRGMKPLEARYRPRLETIRTQLSEDPATTPAEQGFGDHAQTNTEHRASRFSGGDLGWLSDQAGNDLWRNDVLTLAKDLATPGDLSPVTVTKRGMFLVRLIDQRSASNKPFESVKLQITESLKRVKRSDLEAEFLATLGTGGEVTIDQDRLSSLDKLKTRASQPEHDTPPSINLSLNK